MDFITILGLVAASLTTFAFVPQIIKILQTKSTGDISLIMFACISSGTFLWLVYGLLINAFPVIIANSISLMFNLFILICKIRYK